MPLKRAPHCGSSSACSAADRAAPTRLVTPIYSSTVDSRAKPELEPLNRDFADDQVAFLKLLCLCSARQAMLARRATISR